MFLSLLFLLTDLDFRLDGPLVSRVNWSTHGMISADVNGDGRLDLILANNGRARIDLLIQKASPQQNPSKEWDPEIEDHHFLKKHVVIGQSVLGLAVGDLNHDGRLDLVFTGRPMPLTIRFQTEQGTFEDEKIFKGFNPTNISSSIVCQDLNNDGRDDLAVLFESELVVMFQDQKGEMLSLSHYDLPVDINYYLAAADLNGDGLIDLHYQASDSNQAWRIRLQDSQHRFDFEESFKMDPDSEVWPIRRSTPTFAWLDSSTGLLEIAETVPPQEGYVVRQFSTGVSEGKPVFGLAETQGGVKKILVADPNKPEFRVLTPGNEKSQVTVETVASYNALRSLDSGDLDGDGKFETYLVSSEEKALGVSHQKDGRFHFPDHIDIDGTPLVVSVLDGKKNRLAVVSKKDRKFFLHVFHPYNQKVKPVVMPLDLQSDPTAMISFDFDGDGWPGLAIFGLQAPVHMILAKGQDLVEANQDSGFKKSLVDNLKSVNFQPASSLAQNAFLVGGEGFTRLMHVHDGNVDVLEQFNAHESEKISAATSFDLLGDSNPELLMIREKEGVIDCYSRKDGQSVWIESVEIGPLKLEALWVTDLDQNQNPDLLLLGRKRIVWIQRGKPAVQLKRKALYESPDDDVVLGLVFPGDLGNGAGDELVVIDPSSQNSLEVLDLTKINDPKRILHFKIFERDPHARSANRKEKNPREALFADLTGDGRGDLVLLIHDRVLIYPSLAR